MKRNVIKQGGDYQYFEVTKEQPLLDFLLEHLQGQSRTKIKATLQGHGVLVGKTCQTRHDFPLVPGMRVAVSKTKRNLNILRSRYVKIVMKTSILLSLTRPWAFSQWLLVIRR